MPNVPRKAFIASVNTGRPARQEPTADSLSQTSARGVAPHCDSSAHCPASRSGPCRLGNMRALITRE